MHLWVWFLLPLNCTSFCLFVFKFQTWFLVQSWQNWTKALSKNRRRRKKCPQLPAWFVSSTAWITDCPPHSATSPLLLHDLLPLIPFPLFLKIFFVLFSFSVPMYMLLICFIYWDIFNELRDCNVAVYTASLASKNKDVMQLPGVWDLCSWLHSPQQRLRLFLAPHNVLKLRNLAKKHFLRVQRVWAALVWAVCRVIQPGMDLKTQHLPLDQDLEIWGKIIPKDLFPLSATQRKKKTKTPKTQKRKKILPAVVSRAIKK